MNVLKKIGRGIVKGLRSIIPVKGDTRSELVRKTAFLLALTVFLCSGYYLIDEVWMQPHYTQEVTQSLRDLYTKGENNEIIPPDDDAVQIEIPEGVTSRFVPLYRRNQDVVAWLTFKANSGGTTADLFNGAIDNPVVQAKDNDYYLYRNYLGESDKAGTLYMDYRNDMTNLAAEKNVVIYGHNLNSGLMFSKFNQLVSGKVERARAMTTLTMDTLYGETITYKVFAVMVIDADPNIDKSAKFDYTRTSFLTDVSFTGFVGNIRKRSIYDFGDVDVLPGDQLLTLSTCSNKRDTTLKEGRTVVVARRVREGEDVSVDTTKTVLNEDVLMPKAWYVNKKKDVPEVYQ